MRFRSPPIVQPAAADGGRRFLVTVARISDSRRLPSRSEAKHHPALIDRLQGRARASMLMAGTLDFVRNRPSPLVGQNCGRTGLAWLALPRNRRSFRSGDPTMSRRVFHCGFFSLLLALAASLVCPTTAQAQGRAKKPNIIFIMGDDIGWFNVGAYHRGMMACRTPNLDRLGRARNAVHRLLRRGKLHGRSGEFHHRPVAHSHRPHHGWPGRGRDWHARAGADDRYGAGGDGLRHRAVRQESLGR